MQMSPGVDFENGSKIQYSDEYQIIIRLIIAFFNPLEVILLDFRSTPKMDTQLKPFKVISQIYFRMNLLLVPNYV